MVVPNIASPRLPHPTWRYSKASHGGPAVRVRTRQRLDGFEVLAVAAPPANFGDSSPSERRRSSTQRSSLSSLPPPSTHINFLDSESSLSPFSIEPLLLPCDGVLGFLSEEGGNPSLSLVARWWSRVSPPFTEVGSAAGQWG